MDPRLSSTHNRLITDTITSPRRRQSNNSNSRLQQLLKLARATAHLWVEMIYGLPLCLRRQRLYRSMLNARSRAWRCLCSLTNHFMALCSRRVTTAIQAAFTFRPVRAAHRHSSILDSISAELPGTPKTEIMAMSQALEIVFNIYKIWHIFIPYRVSIFASYLARKGYIKVEREKLYFTRWWRTTFFLIHFERFDWAIWNNFRVSCVTFFVTSRVDCVWL